MFSRDAFLYLGENVISKSVIKFKALGFSNCHLHLPYFKPRLQTIMQSIKTFLGHLTYLENCFFTNDSERKNCLNKNRYESKHYWGSLLLMFILSRLNYDTFKCSANISVPAAAHHSFFLCRERENSYFVISGTYKNKRIE